MPKVNLNICLASRICSEDGSWPDRKDLHSDERHLHEVPLNSMTGTETVWGDQRHPGDGTALGYTGGNAGPGNGRLGCGSQERVWVGSHIQGVVNISTFNFR